MKIPNDIARQLRGATSGAGATRPNTWQSVQDRVLDRIRSHEWAPGALIPTEQELAVEFGCARATVNRALRELADIGIIERRRKVGTRITANPKRRAMPEIPILRKEISATGASYSHELISAGSATPPSDVAAAMLLRGAEPVLHSKSRQLADGRVYCCEEAWINRDAAPELTAEALETVSASEWLTTSAFVTRGSMSVNSFTATEDYAAAMGLPIASALLVIERTIWNDLAPIALFRQYFGPGYRLVSSF